eukprot:1119163-Pleurochrysis_carterae.AAC.1
MGRPPRLFDDSRPLRQALISRTQQTKFRLSVYSPQSRFASRESRCASGKDSIVPVSQVQKYFKSNPSVSIAAFARSPHPPTQRARHHLSAT